MQPGDVPVTYADVSKLERAINSYSKILLNEGIPKFVKWYMDYYRYNLDLNFNQMSNETHLEMRVF